MLSKNFAGSFIIWRWLSLFTVLVALIAPASAGTFQLPGSRVVIEAPAGFALSSDFVGLEHPSGASIIIVDFPAAAYVQLKAGFNPKALARANFIDAKPLKLTRGDDFLAFEGKVGGVMTRFMLVVADDKTTALLTVNIPDQALESGAIARRDVERSLETVASKQIATEFERNYTLGYLGSFKHAADLNVLGKLSLYNLAGKLPGKPVERQEPNFTVLQIPVVQMNDAPTTDLKVRARRLLSATNKRSNTELVEEKPISISGLDGWEHTATAWQINTKEKVGLYSVTLLDKNDMLIQLLGSMPISDFEKLLPEYRKIAASFRRNP